MKIQQTGLGRNLIRRLALLGVALLGSLSAVAAPAITGVTPPADRTYLGGEFLTFQVAFDEAVLVTGTPQLGLTIGSSAVNAVYEGGSGKMNLVFRYRVQPGDADSDGIAVTTPLALNSGTIKNAGGSDTTLTFTAPSTAAINVDGTQIPAAVLEAYLKADNAGASDQFCSSVAISGDTVVVGTSGEDSNATTVNGDGSDNSASAAGAAYVFKRSGSVWIQEAYLKADNAESFDQFAFSVAISGDTLVVGAPGESSNATTVNGDGSDNSAGSAGAAYVFKRDGNSVWTQEAYLKADNAESFDLFGSSVAISGDTVVVGANREASNATTVNGDGSDNSTGSAGAAYVFQRANSIWTQEAYLKADNAGSIDLFGFSLAISGDTVVIGAIGESSNATTVNGDGSDNSAGSAGAAYVFKRNGNSVWTQEAYLKADNAESFDLFGSSVAISGDTVVVGAWLESSNATTVNGDGSDNSAAQAGAAYAFTIQLNSPPAASPVSALTTLEDVNLGAVDLTQIFTDAESASSALTFAVTDNTNPALVTATIGQGRNLVFTVLANQSGTSMITVTATDPGGLTGTVRIVVNVTAVNDAPSAAFASNPVTVQEDAGVQTLSAFAAFTAGLANEAAQTLVGYTVTTDNATLFSAAPAIANSGTLTFTPAPNASGSATVTVVVQDNGGTANGGQDKSTSTFALTVTAVNDPPVADADSYSVNQGDPLVVAAAGVLIGDTDEENDPLTTVQISGTTQGPIALAANGGFTYTPDTTFFGTDSFTYQANDGQINSASATVTITVRGRPTNGVPTLQAVFSNEALRFSATNLPVTNPILVGDPDSAQLLLSLSVTNGVLAVTETAGLLLANGASSANLLLSGALTDLNNALESLAYTPRQDYFGDDHIALISTDEGGRTNRGNGGIPILVEVPTLGGVPRVSLNGLNNTNTGLQITNAVVINVDSNLVNSVSYDPTNHMVNVIPIARQDGSTNRSTVTVNVMFNDGTTRTVVVPIIIFQPLLTQVSTNTSSAYNGTFLTPLFNFQTGLFEQKVTVSNTTPVDFTALRLTATNLPATVTLQNATVTNGALPYIDYNLTVPAGGGVVLKLEYFSSDMANFTPGLLLELLNEVRTNTVPTNTTMTAVAPFSGFSPDGVATKYVLFPTELNRIYFIQYQDVAGPVWQTSPVHVTGTGFITIWLDDGPPNTATPPGAIRFYRVVTEQ